jgi:hypothetical protein
MKTFFILLCLIISGEMANAAIQTTTSQDKPPRIYVKSYNKSDSGCGIASYWGTEESLIFSESVNWQDGAAGNASWTSHVEESGFGVWNINVNWNWPANSWPNLSCNLVEIYNSAVAGYTNSYSTNYTNQSTPVAQEHCNINFSQAINPYFFAGYYDFDTATEGRSAQTIMKLQTGGKAISKLRNLFALSASATQLNPSGSIWDAAPFGTSYPNGIDYSYVYNQANGTNIPSQNISIGSYGNLNANGTKYLILPDNADIDVTPNVSGVDYYSFNLGTPQKYHSYFDLYVQQPNPGYSFIFFNPTNDVGHAFWRFRTDAPSDALQYVSPSLTSFLGHFWGFYPNNTTNFFTAPGILQNDDGHSANIERTLYIGIPDLFQGLIFTSATSNAPPVYSLSGYNCVSAAREAGFRADVFGLPGDTSPQNFGVTLIEMYPAPGQIIGPFIDTSDIFYSSAPY